MRATNAGKRRSRAKTTPDPIERVKRPARVARSQYETMPDKAPGENLVMVPISHRFEGVDGPTVDSMEAAGYKEREAGPLGIVLSPNHKLMTRPASECEKLEGDRHDEFYDLLAPPDAPQSNKEMQDAIQGRIKSSGSRTGSAASQRISGNQSLSEITVPLRQREMEEREAVMRMNGAPSED